MLEKLFDFILQFINLFRFWEVLDPYQEGVVIRLGKFNRVIECGFHWIWPLGVEHVITENVAIESYPLATQLLTTKDQVVVAIGVAISARVKNVKKFLLEVENADAAMVDVLFGVVGQLVNSHTWDELQTSEFKEQLVKESQRSATKFGIEILTIGFRDFSKIKAIRIIN